MENSNCNMEDVANGVTAIAKVETSTSQKTAEVSNWRRGHCSSAFVSKYDKNNEKTSKPLSNWRSDNKSPGKSKVSNWRTGSRSPVYFSKIQYQRNWRSSGRLSPRKNDVRYCPWQRTQCSPLNNETTKGTPSQTSHNLTIYNSLKVQKRHNSDSPMKKECSSPTINDHLTINKPLKIQQRQNSVSPVKEKRSSPTKSHHLESFNPLKVETQKSPLPAKEKSQWRIIPRNYPPEKPSQQLNRLQQLILYPKPAQKQQVHIPKGVNKRYRSFGQKRIGHLKSSTPSAVRTSLQALVEDCVESKTTKTLNDHSPSSTKLPHLKFARIGDHASALKTALTYYALGAFCNAPKASELPMPPKHWIQGTFQSEASAPKTESNE